MKEKAENTIFFRKRSLKKAAKESNKRIDQVDQILKNAYPFLSFGLGLVDPDNLNVLKNNELLVCPNFLPFGEEDVTVIVLTKEPTMGLKLYISSEDGRTMINWKLIKILM